MGPYLERLHTQYTEVMAAVDSTINRAADENRDVTDDETAQVERDRNRLTELRAEIDRYSAIERDQAEVANLRAAAPVPTRATARNPEPEEFDIARAFPSVAHYAITVHRATALRDPEARALLERATAHQTTADNPGIIPRPVLGPVLNFLLSGRPFINSISNRPLPAGKFDRPVITQHVAVDKQAAEKDLTASQKMVIGSLAATAATYAGHLNISRQDVKWTSPSILQIVYDDFAAIYANVTDNDAADQFVASVDTPPIAVDSWAEAGAALFSGSAQSLAAGGVFPDSLWVSPDVWAAMGGAVNTANGNPIFPSLSVTSNSGNPLGLRLVVDPNFDAGTMIMGPSRYAEWYEDLDGLMQVGEPDVLGQLVGYAGYGAFVNVCPEAFAKFEQPTPPVGGAASSGGSSSTSTTATAK